MRDLLEKCLEENGIDIKSDGTLGNFDSISFISALVEIEEEFQIVFPDTFLTGDGISNIDFIIEMIQNLKTSHMNKNN